MIYLLLLLHLFLAPNNFEGKISYTVKAEAAPQYLNILSQLEDTHLILYIKDDKYCLYRQNPKLPYPIFDGIADYLINFSERKAIKTVWENDTKKLYDMVKTNTYETKQILGYKCTLYKGVLKDSTKYDMWITNEIKVQTTDKKGFLDKNLGVALEILATTSHFKLHYKAHKIDSISVDNNIFRVPKGFKIEEFNPKNMEIPKR